MIAGTKVGYILYYNFSTDSLTKFSIGHNSSVKCLMRIDSERYASGSADSTIKVWSSTSGNLIRNLTGHTGSVNCLEKVNSIQFASGGSDSTIRFWGYSLYTPLYTIFSAHSTLSVLCLKRLPGGFLASGSTGSGIIVPNLKVNCGIFKFPIN